MPPEANPLFKLRADEMLFVGPRFKPIPRVSATARDLSARLAEHAASGIPLLVHDCNQLEGWDEDAFSVEALRPDHSTERVVREYADGVRVDARPALKQEDGMPAGPVYLKDHACPTQWERQLRSLQGPISTLLPLSNSDLTTFLPERTRPETLMCYIGQQGTRTVLHRDRCASVGQNLMAHTADGGHSIWLLTETSDAERVARHFKSDDIVVEFEHHEASLDELSAADFTVYIGEQHYGDLIIIPSRSTHQVINRGGLTCKIAWSRMTTESISLSLSHDLPIYNILRVPEIYRTKLLLHHVVLGLTEEVKAAGILHAKSAATQLTELLPEYDRLLADEATTEDVSLAEDTDALLVCDSCGQDIFRVHWLCDDESACNNQDGERVMVCSACYAVGRTCACRVMKPLALLSIERMLEVRNSAAAVVRLDSDERRLELDLPSVLAMKHLSMARAAEAIYTKRNEPAKHITCHYLNYHAIWAVEGHFCRRCSRRVCFRCFGSRARVHAAEVLLTTFPPESLHRLHRDEVPASERSPQAVRLGEAVVRAHLARAPPAGTAGGWYDPLEDGEPFVPITPAGPQQPETSRAAQKRKRELRDEEKGDEALAFELSGMRATRRRRSDGDPASRTNGTSKGSPSVARSRPRKGVGARARGDSISGDVATRDGPSLEEIRSHCIDVLGWDVPPVPAQGSPGREAYAERIAGKLMQVLAEQHKAQTRMRHW